MRGAISSKPNPLKQAYAALDVVIEEVVQAEEETLKAICTRLREANLQARDPVIDQILGILGDWGKVPASELRERAGRL